jgi:hypothetical protein
MNTTGDSGATFDETGAYRYALWRVWEPSKPRLCFVLLNPSTADAERNDPTIRRCLGFARTWDFGGVEVVNLYAYRATRPAALFRAADPVGPENDRYLAEAVSRAGRVVVGWGNQGAKPERLTLARALLHPTAFCFGITSAGQPRHPLYVRADTPPEPWQG